MKVVGLPYEKFVTSMKHVDPALVFKHPHQPTLEPHETTYQGYLAYPGSVTLVPTLAATSCLTKVVQDTPGAPACPSPTHTHNAMHAKPTPHGFTKWLHKPCVHAQLEVARLALNAGATRVYLSKHCLTKGTWHTRSASVKKKSAAAGETCVHTAAAVGVPLTHIPDPTTAVAPPSPAGVVFAEPMVDGPPLGGGVGIAEHLAKRVMRDTMAAVASLYLLQEVALSVADARAALMDHTPVDRWTVAAHTHTTPATAPTAGPAYDAAVWATVRATVPWYSRAAARVTFIDDFETFVQRYALALARNFFDYLTMACAGESRHCPGGKWTDGKPSTRHEAWQRALVYDPRSLLPTLQAVFLHGKWGGAYGGPKWAFIAHEAQRYWTLAPLVFVDHVNSLQHNGGLAFNKGYVLSMPGSSYMTMLNTKQQGSLLASGTWPMSTWAHPAAPTHTTQWALAGARGLGILETIGATLVPTPDPDVPPFTWGSKPFSLAIGGSYVKATSSTLPTLHTVTHGGDTGAPAPPWDSDPADRRAGSTTDVAV